MINSKMLFAKYKTSLVSPPLWELFSCAFLVEAEKLHPFNMYLFFNHVDKSKAICVRAVAPRSQLAALITCSLINQQAESS